MLTFPQLAHELNSLLDGALRCLGLAERNLLSAAVAQEVRSDIALARESLARMAVLLERAMRAGSPRISVLSDDRPLRQTVQRVRARCRALAGEHHVTLTWSLDPAAGGIVTGLLEPVLLNGLRNAIAAAAESAPGDRRVGLSAAVDGRDLEICISDTGPGVGARSPSPAGHGLGLQLCGTIAGELEGTVELIPAPCTRGTVMRIRVPLERLGKDGR